MPVIEKGAQSTSVVAAGWTDPTNAFRFDDSLAYTETDNAEQEYAGFGIKLAGTETIDKVFVKVKHTTKVTTIAVATAATFICYIKVYNGSTWQTYQVTSESYTRSTPNTNKTGTADAGGDATHTVDAERTEAEDFWNDSYITFTSGTNNGLTRLVTDFVAATDTLTHDAFPAVVALGDTYYITDIDTVTDGDTSNQTSMIDVTSFLNTIAKINAAAIRLLLDITVAGVGVTPRWSVDAVTLLVCYSPSSAGTTHMAVTKTTYPPQVIKAFDAVEKTLELIEKT